MPTLPPQLHLWLTQFNQALAESEAAGINPTPDLARQGLSNITEQCVTEPPAIARITDTQISRSSIPCRIYQPAVNSPLPVILFIHGGGHMCGSIEVYDPISRKLASACCCNVVSIDYRLAPEHPYPAGLEDAYTSLANLFLTLDEHRIQYQSKVILIGDSAGGAMATTLVQQDTSPSPMVEKLVLIYPSLDYTFSSPSLIENGTGYLLETKKIRWYFEQYLQHQEDRRQVSPLFGDIPTHHPETLVITAGLCPIKDDGIRYLQRLERAGIPCRSLHLENMLHAYLNLEDLAKPECEQTYTAICQFIHN